MLAVGIHPTRTSVAVLFLLAMLVLVAIPSSVRADIRSYVGSIRCNGDGGAGASWDWTDDGIVIPGASGGLGCSGTGSATSSPGDRPASADGIHASLSACVRTGNIRPIFKCDSSSATDTIDPAKSYSLTLHVNVAISGGLSESATFKLDQVSVAPSTTPSAPQALGAIPGDGTVALSWLYPSSDGGSVVTEYRVYRGTSPGGETFLATAGTGYAYLDTSVTDGTRYYYQVTAVTQVGESPRSNEANATLNSPNPTPLYAVMFIESGLPDGTSWYATLGGLTHTSTARTITFTEADGTYAYVVGHVSGFTASPSSGSVTVNGADIRTSVIFTAAPQPSYQVIFTESGLPSGTSWSVTLSGTTHASATTNVVFDEPNGTYAYSVGPVPGYTGRPASGTTSVYGTGATQEVTFSIAPSGLTISSFLASSPTIALGSSVTFMVTATGGTGALNYAYAGLPSGCSSANVSALTCMPTVTGSFTIRVTVTDSTGRNATTSVALTVNSQTTPGGPASNTIPGLPSFEGYAILAAVALAIVIGGIIAVTRSRRKRERIQPKGGEK